MTDRQTDGRTACSWLVCVALNAARNYHLSKQLLTVHVVPLNTFVPTCHKHLPMSACIVSIGLLHNGLLLKSTNLSVLVIRRAVSLQQAAGVLYCACDVASVEVEAQRALATARYLYVVTNKISWLHNIWVMYGESR